MACWIPGPVTCAEDEASHLADSRFKQKNDEDASSPRFNRLHCL